jgi:signal recognition particle receptor subunit beta
MFINKERRELGLKIVYYGPALSGKTTNLEQIYARVDPQRRSRLTTLKTRGDRTIYFDFLQIELGKIGGLTPKIQLFTVPGQTYYEATRKMVLQGADGIVFVVDSTPSRIHTNLSSWRDMKRHLTSPDGQTSTIPIVVQFNKQDLRNAIPPTVLTNLLNLNGSPSFAAVAIDGQGVFDTLRAIVQNVIRQVQRKLT